MTNSKKDFAQTISMKSEIENVKHQSTNIEKNLSKLMEIMEANTAKQNQFINQFNIDEIARKIEAPILRSITTLNKEMDQRVKAIENSLSSMKNALISQGILKL